MIMPAIIHINDNNLLIEQGDQIFRSQGYAWLAAGEVYFDLSSENNALQHCRLEPQQINSRYWQQCEPTTIASNDSGMRHAADLVWRHLAELKTKHQLTDVVLIVPSHYQAKNLQLLLGIAKSCELQVLGLINKSVYALHQQVSGDGFYLHCDVQLHQSVCSEVIVEDGMAKLGSVEILHQVGLQAMQDALLKTIQDRFISSDRFDPLHYAETEQQLFGQLPKLAEQIAAQGKGNLSVHYQGQQHMASIDRKQWDQSVASFVKKLNLVEIDAQPDLRFYDFNGFQATDIAGTVLNSPPTVLHVSDLTTNQGGQLIYRTEWLCKINEFTSNAVAVEQKLHAETPETVSSSKENSRTATHLLQAGIAVPLQYAGIALQGKQLKLEQMAQSNLQKMLQLKELFIVGDTERQTVQADDRLGSNLADGVITVIHVAQAMDDSV